ncbi:tyrosine-type recombinase/integrase [Oceanisphaera pacifica]|uniref:Tyrosine-type recombinase/integrase n=1 Tax=Oceanisphaera pacifica TaxID=2818389 RepID=A0ABS3NBY1_9GAMM|nr:site-specific integrase [Oceanisphaera pacifica]MBO1518108.1 tyrosine-type recombinase/integrase [Oceanisphaera pacifica]
MTLAKSTKPLTTRTIQTMKPSSNDLSDTGENRGLRVACGSTGLKTFFYRYTSPETGKLVQAKIGNFPETSLAEARSILQDWKLLRRQKICPANEIKRKRKEEKERSLLIEQGRQTFTVQDLIELYLTSQIEDQKLPNGQLKLGSRKPKGQIETRRTLYIDVVPFMGSRPATDILRKDVIKMVMSIVSRGANVQAGSVLRELSAAYEYAIGIDRLPDDFANPALLAKAGLRQAKIKLTSKPGRRVLSDKEVIKLIKWLPSSDYTNAQKKILHLTLLTGCRTGELCNAQWKDFDAKEKKLHIRETKTATDRYVQLPSQAVNIIKKLPFGTTDAMFPSKATGLPVQQKKLSEQSWVMRNKGTMLDIDHWTPHDLRRTVRTGLARLQCPNEVAEAILGHARSGIEGTYDLHRYESECQYWLQIWADYLDSIVSG